MNLEDYRTVFVAVSLVLILIAAAPTLSLIIAFPKGERFSEFWILGPDHLAEDFPFNIGVNESYNVFVGVGNHMGGPSYYLVYVKFRNQTQPLPDLQNSKPSPLAPLYEFRALVPDGGVWEKPLEFSVSDVSLNGYSISVSRLAINDEVFGVNVSTIWDPVHNGFYYQLFLELWLYNGKSQSFQYHQRFVGIWLNVTATA